MRPRLLIIAIVLIMIPVGFFYYISINGFSFHHAGIYVEMLSEKKLEGFSGVSEPKAITQEELIRFPQIYTMINLLLEEKDNPPRNTKFLCKF